MSTQDASRLVILGLDVHKDTIMACRYDPATAEIERTHQFPNTPDQVAKLVRRLRASGCEPRVCYEASSCGFVIYRQLRGLGVECAVIAPSRIPRCSGDRIKTDRRDAEKLATLFAAGLLTAIEVPDEELERVRALVRCRADLVGNLTQTKHRTTRLLQARGQLFREGTNWSLKFRHWLKKIELDGADHTVLTTYRHLIEYLEGQIKALEGQLEQESKTDRFRDTVHVLGAFRGVALVTAMTLACELGDIRRFASPRQLMAFLGLVASEHSSGSTTRRGPITKTGNIHARKALVSAAWKYAARPARSQALKNRQLGLSPAVVATAWKAQLRLNKKFHSLTMRKPRSVAAVAVARELSGFLWAAMNTLTTAATPTTA